MGSPALAALAFAALALLAACASDGPARPEPLPPPEPEGPPPRERPYLLPPAEGWDGAAAPEQLAALDSGHEALLAGDDDGVRAALDALADSGAPAADYPPAAVLAAQAEALAGDWSRAQARLASFAEEHPGYAALQLLLGRAAERAGDPIASFAAFHRLGDAHPLAAEQVRELRPRVVRILLHRLDDALSAGDVAAAAEPLARLRAWAPDEELTWQGAHAVAVARGDREGELEAVRQLARLGPLDPVDAERRAELELEIGDPMHGLQAFERLAAADPDDERLAERVAYAKFRWRVSQMPPRVGQAASSPALDRGDLAVLAYWLVPQVRSTRGSAGRIASDILDDPRREEMARVINLGLMDVDAALHKFYPQRPATRRALLLVALRLLAAGGADACVEAAPSSSAGGERVCAAAIGCGLVTAEEACEPAAQPSGQEAVETMRRTVVRLSTAPGAP